MRVKIFDRLRGSLILLGFWLPHQVINYYWGFMECKCGGQIIAKMVTDEGVVLATVRADSWNDLVSGLRGVNTDVPKQRRFTVFFHEVIDVSGGEPVRVLDRFGVGSNGLLAAYNFFSPR